MFVQNGFNDMLAKPIELSKLDEMLIRWMPKEKIKQEIEIREKTIGSNEPASGYVINGVDIAKGIALTGGTMTGYFQVLVAFRKDVENRLPLLQTVPEMDSLLKFITQVHAIKSASASIGAADVSAQAAKLEAAGNAEDLALIEKQLPVFTKHLAKLVEEIQAWEISAREAQKPKNPEENKHDPAKILLLINELVTILKSKKISDIDRILDELNQKLLDSKTKEALEQISDYVLLAEFDNAIKVADELIAAKT
jgi:HPt (histidine-containing phosphotransfer) domain-containing protein